jgi:predicted acylesterase/phospholipase RssA
MKGGISSGIVYPAAIDEIAARFHLASIGGTSAGAIAAAFGAAAEYQRRRGSNRGFELLKAVPEQLGGDGKLLGLFKPDAATKSIFDLAINVKTTDGGLLCKAFKLGPQFVRVAVSSPLKTLRQNGFGLCSGMAVDNRSSTEAVPPLTEWLDQQINQIAGLGTDRPLTFGDLWDAPPPKGFVSLVGPPRSIDLQMVSTCVTFGRPYVLPFLSRDFSFCPGEFRKLFPKRVVDYLVDEGNKIAPNLRVPLPKGLLPLPVGAKLPVVVATRMSLSFPVLFTLVPLYHTDYRAADRPPRPTFFSDGGLTSNLPIHFFDSPVPRWPTLAINLQYCDEPGKFGRSHVDDLGVWLSGGSGDGRLEMFHDFGQSGGEVSRLISFVMSLFQSSQNWHDNSLLVLPGYADRVGEIWLDRNEGGLNINMPAAVLERLRKKGQRVGERLAGRFADAPMGDWSAWDQHRWSRFLSVSAAQADEMRSYARGTRYASTIETSVLGMLRSAKPPGYPFASAEAKEACDKVTETWLNGVDAMDNATREAAIPADAASRPFVNAPKPSVRLSVRASMGVPAE